MLLKHVEPGAVVHLLEKIIGDIKTAASVKERLLAENERIQ